MKRARLTREQLVQHEAGHLVAMTMLGCPSTFTWRRLTRFEIAHVAPAEGYGIGWECQATRNATIAHRAAIALAGGAAEYCAGGGRPEDSVSVEAVHVWTGAVDFELAHEWLTLQRYDGRQEAIETDMRRLFVETCRMLGGFAQRRALRVVEARLLERLRDADAWGEDALRMPAQPLAEGLRLDPPPVLALHATLSRPEPFHAHGVQKG